MKKQTYITGFKTFVSLEPSTEISSNLAYILNLKDDHQLVKTHTHARSDLHQQAVLGVGHRVLDLVIYLIIQAFC